MLIIRIDTETKEMIAYLKLHKVKYASLLKPIIKKELNNICDDYKKESRRKKNEPAWLYD